MSAPQGLPAGSATPGQLPAGPDPAAAGPGHLAGGIAPPTSPHWPQPPAPADICFSVTLDVEPVAKGRPRVSPAEYTVIGGQKVRTRKAHGYTPKSTSAYEEHVGWLLRQARVKCADEGDLGVRAVFHVTGGQEADADNLVKALLDAGNGIGWGDDKQFVQQVVDVVRGSSRPQVQLTVYRVAGDAR